MGAMMLMMDPCCRTPLVDDLGIGRRLTVGEGHAPVGAVLLAAAKPDERMAAP
jgi:hypothetical protein